MISFDSQENKWIVSGEVLVDNANSILVESVALPMNDALQIDFSAVTNTDTAAISLMLEWQRRAAASNHKITFKSLPDGLGSLATLYGVADFIPLSD
ncbi:MAG: STAS domain-containing protein [Methylotenera sp.]|nr:STAS domain-containing protein [Methylotenera sp.]